MRFGLLTVSDACSAGTRDDESGARLRAWAEGSGHEVALQAIVPDDVAAITRTLLAWCDGGEIDVALTTGGTGFGPRDVTPEATRPLLDREAPGLAEHLRREGLRSTPYAVLSRGVVGVRGRVLVANLPGSPAGADEGARTLEPLLGHITALLAGARPSHEPGAPRPDPLDEGAR